MSEVILKLNNRIVAERMSSNECIFLVDGLKKASFIPHDKRFYELLTMLAKNGLKRESINSINTSVHRKRAQEFIGSLEANGFIDYIIILETGLKVIICPTKKQFQFPVIEKCCTNRLTISSHTYIRFLKNTVILENPLSNFRVCVEDSSFDLQMIIDKQKTMGELVSILLAGSFIIHDESSEHSKWEFHDLLFHTQSRLGMVDDSSTFGGTYKFKPANIENYNGFKDYCDKKYFQFNAPTLDKNLKVDFFELLCIRKSTRSFQSDKFVNYKQIGEFLFHSARVTSSTPNKGNLNFIKRTFPSAGGIHDLEFYLLINRNDVLLKDIYYYHPEKHGLYQLHTKDGYIDEITQNAMVALGNDKDKEVPPVIVILTSRFKKMSSKYERIAYRNTILSVGAAFQTMYLTGTALDLSTCALGSGNPYLFAEAIEVDPLEECAVGEFVLSSNL